MNYYNRLMNYFSKHVTYGHTIHFLGGFGLAILIAHYYPAAIFMTPTVGWVLVALCAAGHLVALMR